mmetsp:Transcript_67173/g.106774  ORF Transcript_67173/g.106774 Transcript_67173/m.106774 type:complete len:82 (-) Transcript_67173:144-389(-)
MSGEQTQEATQLIVKEVNGEEEDEQEAERMQQIRIARSSSAPHQSDPTDVPSKRSRSYDMEMLQRNGSVDHDEEHPHVQQM